MKQAIIKISILGTLRLKIMFLWNAGSTPATGIFSYIDFVLSKKVKGIEITMKRAVVCKEFEIVDQNDDIIKEL
jgi:hypothetical protein